jgi:hypothetical protein
MRPRIGRRNIGIGSMRLPPFPANNLPVSALCRQIDAIAIGRARARCDQMDFTLAQNEAATSKLCIFHVIFLSLK